MNINVNLNNTGGVGFQPQINPDVTITPGGDKDSLTIVGTLNKDGIEIQFSTTIPIDLPNGDFSNFDLEAIQANLIQALDVLNDEVVDIGLTSSQLAMLADAIMSAKGLLSDPKNIPLMTDTIIQQSKNLLAVINESVYPDFTAVLKELIATAQKLRQFAAEGRHAAVQAEVDNLVNQAKEMYKIAENRYQAAMKEINAARAEAITKIVTGIVTGILTIGLAGKLGGGVEGAKFAMQIGTTIASIVESAVSFGFSFMKADAKELEKQVGNSEAFIKTLDANAKTLEEKKQAYEELRQIMHEVIEAALRAFSEYNNSMHQVLQAANI